jgi:hypothetical protein
MESMESHDAGFPPVPHFLEIPSGFPLLEWSAACTIRTLAGGFTMEISTTSIDLRKTTFHLIGLSPRGEIRDTQRSSSMLWSVHLRIIVKWVSRVSWIYRSMRSRETRLRESLMPKLSPAGHYQSWCNAARSMPPTDWFGSILDVGSLRKFDVDRVRKNEKVVAVAERQPPNSARIAIGFKPRSATPP